MPAPAKPAGHTQRDVRVGDEGAVEDRVVALCRAHAEDVPRLLDAIPLGVAGRNAWTICGAAGLLVSMAWRPRNVQTGDSEPKILWPVISQPPSTRSAALDDSSSGMSLPASPWPAANTSPSATAAPASTRTTGRRPQTGRRRCRSSRGACSSPRAVAGATYASRRCSRLDLGQRQPVPPNSVGTAALR